MTDPENAAISPRDVLDFWLVEVGKKGWFRQHAAIDAACAQRFGPLVEQAISGGLDPRRDPSPEPWPEPSLEPWLEPWLETADGALALVILFDQFPRNMFRGEAKAFAADPLARRVAEDAVARGHDRAIPNPERLFFYMPFMHSETLVDQDRGVTLIRERAPEEADSLRHAIAHRDLIRRFGRFPHRNKALGRPSTPEEAAHLAGGGYAPGAAPAPERGRPDTD